MKKFSKIILPMLIATFVALAGFSSASALTLKEGASAARCDGCPADLFGNTGVFRQISSTILYIVGVIAVVMLIWGGLRYVISGGDSKKVTDAKNTVLYAIIGLIIAFLSFAIINFVIDALPSSQNPAEEQSSEEQTSLVIDAGSING